MKKTTRALYSEKMHPGHLVSVGLEKDETTGEPAYRFNYCADGPGDIQTGSPVTFSEFLSSSDEDDCERIREIAEMTGWDGQIGDKFDGTKLNVVMLDLQLKPANKDYPASNKLKTVQPAKSETHAHTLGSILAKPAGQKKTADKEAPSAAAIIDKAKGKDGKGKDAAKNGS